MDPILHEKRLEIGRYYLLGMTNVAIEKKTGVSHGSVNNIIGELVMGHLVVPGVLSDEVNDLRKLSIDMAKKGFEPSKAQLGIVLYERFMELGIEPAKVDQWAKLVKVFTPDNFPAKDFFESALKLHQLEEAEGQSFEALADKYSNMMQKSGNLKTEVDAQNQQKENLNENLKSLTLELNKLENKKKEIDASIDLQSKKLEKADDAMVAAQTKLTQTEKDIGTLEKQKIKLGTEVDGKEKVLKSLQELNFSEEDLLRLKNTVERMAKKGGISPEQVKDQFFSALSRFGDFDGLDKATQEESKILGETLKQKSLLVGEIMGLENQKAVLEGEVSRSAAAEVEQIRDASKEAVSGIRHEAVAIREELKTILEDTLVAGLAVGEMSAIQKNGEKAGKELEELVGEVKRRMGGG
jgi:hypothetical protein